MGNYQSGGRELSTRNDGRPRIEEPKSVTNPVRAGKNGCKGGTMYAGQCGTAMVL
jgi:hypothetical protein